MNIKEAREITAEATKGANLSISWERDCKIRKKLKGSKEPITDKITKAVDAVCRIGIDYDNIKKVQDKRESGELPTENTGLWFGKGEWVDFPYIVKHKTTGKLYFRMYYGSNSKPGKCQFKKNGVDCSFADVEKYLLASEKTPKDGDCFYVKLEDVKNIAWKSKEIDRESIKTGAKEKEAEPATA